MMPSHTNRKKTINETPRPTCFPPTSLTECPSAKKLATAVRTIGGMLYPIDECLSNDDESWAYSERRACSGLSFICVKKNSHGPAILLQLPTRTSYNAAQFCLRVRKHENSLRGLGPSRTHNVRSQISNRATFTPSSAPSSS